MKYLALVLSASLTALSLLGCSNSWRQGDTGHTPEEINSMLDEVQSAQGQGLASGDVSTALQYRTGSIVYFADAPGALGPVGSVMSLVDLSFLGIMDGTNVGLFQQVRVFFMDASPNFGLVIGVDQGQGSFQYYGFSGTGGVDGGVFEATLSGSTGSLTVQSDDVSGDVLNDVIQLRVYLNGNYIGKFSTLVGYN